ncbi:hypothetical protein DICSQDRAFT_175949, partial [Dichomitus squalens LYAD-421 SS1]
TADLAHWGPTIVFDSIVVNDPAQPNALAHAYEDCVRKDGDPCWIHGKSFRRQLTGLERVTVVLQVVTLEPAPYESSELTNWCMEYLGSRQALVNNVLATVSMEATTDRGEGSPELDRTQSLLASDVPNPFVCRRSTKSRSSYWLATKNAAGEWVFADSPRQARYTKWVNKLIPLRGEGGSQSTSRAGGESHPASASKGPSTARSESRSQSQTKVGNVFIYTVSGQPPVQVELDAQPEGHMLTVKMRQEALVQALGLNVRTRNLDRKIEVYDPIASKWFHPSHDKLWFRLNIKEGLVLRASGVRFMPGLEDCVLKTLAKALRPGTEELPPFLAYAAARSYPTFGDQPPLTVMSASVSHPTNLPLTRGSLAGHSALKTDTSRVRGGRVPTANAMKPGTGTASRVSQDPIKISDDDNNDNNVIVGRQTRKDASPGKIANSASRQGASISTEDKPATKAMKRRRTHPRKWVMGDVIDISSDDDTTLPERKRARAHATLWSTREVVKLPTDKDTTTMGDKRAGVQATKSQSGNIIEISSDEDITPTTKTRRPKRVLRQVKDLQRVTIPPPVRFHGSRQRPSSMLEVGTHSQDNAAAAVSLQTAVTSAVTSPAQVASTSLAGVPLVTSVSTGCTGAVQRESSPSPCAPSMVVHPRASPSDRKGKGRAEDERDDESDTTLV